MRAETTELVKGLYAEYHFAGPIVDIGGGETNRQFGHLFTYEVWDKRNLMDVDVVIDVTKRLPREFVGYVTTLMSFDTLEHIWDYRAATDNFGMIVKQGGMLMVGVPFAYPFHDVSSDFWRFSHLALEIMFGLDFTRLDSGYYGPDIQVPAAGGVQTSSYYVGRRK